MTKDSKKKVEKKSPQSRRGKKPKVALDTKKVVIASACICAVCVLLLVVFALFSIKNQSGETVKTVENASEKIDAPLLSEKKSDEKKEQDSAVNSAPKKEGGASEKKSNTEKNKTPQNENRSQKDLDENSKKEKPVFVEEEIPPLENENAKNDDSDSPKTDGTLAKAGDAKQKKEKSEKKSAAPVAKDFGFPNAANNAVLCIVFDDGGQNVEQLKKCIELPFPVTIAVLPRLAHSAQSAEMIRKSGNEVILHQPMQALDLNVNPGAGAILPNMSGEEIAATLLQNIEEIAPIAGINNHEGSLITKDKTSMEFVLKTIHQKGIYFLDSRTTSESKVQTVSKEIGYSYYKRDIFLDNQKTRENILSELKKGVEIANKSGCAIMIGHVWSAEILPAVLAEVYPELKQKGYKFSTVSKSGAEQV